MMRPRFAAATLGALALALSGVIRLELEPDAPVGAPPAPPPAAAPAAAEPDDAPASAAAVVARPLFTPGRRPPPPAPRGGDAAAAAKTLALPRLAGVVLGAGERRALFHPAGEAKPVMLSEGQEVVAGWRVATILPDQVTLIGPDGMRTLVPQAEANRDSGRPQPPRSVRPQVRIPPGPPAPRAAPAPGKAGTPAPPGRAEAPQAANRIPARSTDGGRP
jgi:hypothetical protein